MTSTPVAVTRVSVPFHTFLLKIASRCNLACRYCYVYFSEDDGWRRQPGLMRREVVRQAAERIREHLEANGKRDASIILHGGEPMLGGIRHLEMVTDEIASAFSGSGISLSVGMQSNLLLLSPQIANLLVDRGLTVGVSLDGPPEVNDRNRVDHQGRGSSAALEEQLDLLTSPRYRPAFSGFLCVIDPDTDPVDITRYLLQWEPPGIDFLFPLDNHDRPPRGKGGHRRDATPFGDWLIAAFNHWWHAESSTRVRIFNSLIQLMCGGHSLVESLGVGAADLVVIEANGEIEGVDSLKTTFNGAAHLGYNIVDHSFDVVARHAAVQSRQLGADGLCAECRSCSIVSVCGGGYLPHRYSATNGFDNPSVYCADLMVLIRHIHATLNRELVGVSEAAPA